MNILGHIQGSPQSRAIYLALPFHIVLLGCKVLCTSYAIYIVMKFYI